MAERTNSSSKLSATVDFASFALPLPDVEETEVWKTELAKMIYKRYNVDGIVPFAVYVHVVHRLIKAWQYVFFLSVDDDAWGYLDDHLTCPVLKAISFLQS